MELSSRGRREPRLELRFDLPSVLWHDPTVDSAVSPLISPGEDDDDTEAVRHGVCAQGWIGAADWPGLDTRGRRTVRHGGARRRGGGHHALVSDGEPSPECRHAR